MRTGTHPAAHAAPLPRGDVLSPPWRGGRRPGWVSSSCTSAPEPTPPLTRHPSQEGMYYPLFVPRSGGVGLFGSACQEPTPALRATPPRRGAFFIPSLEGWPQAGVGFLVLHQRAGTHPAAHAAPLPRGDVLSPLCGRRPGWVSSFCTTAHPTCDNRRLG